MFSRDNLFYKDYHWDLTIEEIPMPKLISYTDTTKLNRKQGYEVIFFIRCLAKSWNWKDDAIRACQKLEKTIREKVPETHSSFGQIKLWIEENFKSFWDTL